MLQSQMARLHAGKVGRRMNIYHTNGSKNYVVVSNRDTKIAKHDGNSKFDIRIEFVKIT